MAAGRGLRGLARARPMAADPQAEATGRTANATLKAVFAAVSYSTQQRRSKHEAGVYSRPTSYNSAKPNDHEAGCTHPYLARHGSRAFCIGFGGPKPNSFLGASTAPSSVLGPRPLDRAGLSPDQQGHYAQGSGQPWYSTAGPPCDATRPAGSGPCDRHVASRGATQGERPAVSFE